MTKNERDELIKNFEDATGLDLKYTLQDDEHEDIDSLLDALREQANEIECTYYNSAMEYLSENDPSLRTSLELAHDMGMTTDNLNSETLATLLMQQNAHEAINEWADELETLITNE